MPGHQIQPAKHEIWGEGGLGSSLSEASRVCRRCRRSCLPLLQIVVAASASFGSDDGRWEWHCVKESTENLLAGMRGNLTSPRDRSLLGAGSHRHNRQSCDLTRVEEGRLPLGPSHCSSRTKSVLAYRLISSLYQVGLKVQNTDDVPEARLGAGGGIRRESPGSVSTFLGSADVEAGRTPETHSLQRGSPQSNPCPRRNPSRSVLLLAKR